MKRIILTAVLFAAFLSTAYCGTAKRIYVWVNYPKKALFERGVSIRLNNTHVGYIKQGHLAIINIAGDKKYKLGVYANGALLAEANLDSLTAENSYVHGDLKVSESILDKTSIEEKRAFVNGRDYATTVDFNEEGMSDEPGGYSSAYGSAFLVSSDGYIVTNYHVVDGHKTVKVKGIGGKFVTEYEADVVVRDINNDLVLLRLKDTAVKFPSPPYTIKTQGINTGEDISVLGYPLGPALGDEIKLTTGVISARSGVGGSVSSFQISAAAQPGNSGGPLFDGQGNIIGVVNAKIRNAENMTYAVKAVYIQTLLSMLPEEAHLPQANTLLGKTLPERVAASSKFVYIIKCE